jgi:hypothetical protein
MERADGRKLTLSAPGLLASIHGQAGLSCVDCHADLAAVTEFPHAEKLAPAACGACHDAPAAAYATSVHATAREKDGASPAATCVDCHGGHEIRASQDPESLTHHLEIAATCERCHGNEDVIRRGRIAAGNVPALFEDSIHGRALRRKGLVVAPHCASCHGSHDVRRAADAQSKVHHANVPATCGACHQGILAPYQASVHGQAVREGRNAAVCSDCHSAHQIASTVPAFRLGVVSECGTCHAQSLRTFRDTFHGRATSLGFVRAATCADCHGAHDVRREEDPRSRVSPALRKETCARCHPGAGANFARYDPHADPHDRKRNPALYYTSQFMKLLLGSVFAFFGVHTALWLPRSWRVRRLRLVSGGGGKSGERA